MNTSFIPWSILSSSVGTGIGAEGWNLAEIGPAPDDTRSFSIRIAFVSRFSLPPVVHLALTGLDADPREATRISLKTGLITESGFQAIISTWSTSRIYGVDFNWLAIGA